MIVFSTFLTLLVGYILWYFIKLIKFTIRTANMTSNIPGPKPWPFIGNVLMLAKLKTQKDIYNKFLNLYQTYQNSDRIFKIWIGPKLVVVLGHSKFIEAVLSNQDAIEKAYSYQYLQLAGSGILTSNGSEWHELRRPLNKIWNKKMIESNIEMFHQKALTLCKVLKRFAENDKIFDIKHILMNYGADTLSISSFGYDLNELERERFNIAETLERSTEIFYNIMMQFPHNISLTYTRMSSAGRELKKMLKPYWTVCHEMIQGRMEKNKLIGEGNEGNPILSGDVFINKIRRDKLSWEETGKLLTDFVIAGSDTSATVISHTLLMLAIFPEHQDAVYKEQIALLGEDPEIGPTWDQLSQMTYLTKVLKEVIRFLGPVIILRNVSNDIDLGSYKLPKDSVAMISFYSLHRDPQYWSHPEEFYPDHFLPEEVASRPKAAYLPFSSGPRSCPGNLYAMILMKIAISTVIRKYNLETHLKFKELTYKMSLMLEIANGCLVKIKPRNIST